jgi:L-lactate utilization protein LutB
MKESKKFTNHLAAIELPKTLLGEYILQMKIDCPYHPSIKILQVHWDNMVTDC